MKTQWRWMEILLGAMLVLVFGGLTFAQEKWAVIDMASRRVEVPKNPGRILCLGPGTLRLICYLKAMDRVVGIEKFEKTRPAGRAYLWAHPALDQLPSVSAGGPASINKEPDLEAVLRVNPQLIFITLMEASKADALQKKLGIPVVLLSYGGLATFDDVVFGSLRLAGNILNLQPRAEKVIAFIEGARKDLQQRTRGIPEESKPRVYVGAIGFRGTQGIESTDASYFPLDWIHARQVVKEVAAQGHLFIDKEKILSWNPDLIFLDGGGLHLVRQDYAKKPEFYQRLSAFQKRRVYVLYPYNWYATNIDTAILDGYTAGKILYPTLFAEIDPRQKADAVYSLLLGRSVYESMQNEFGPIGSVGEF